MSFPWIADRVALGKIYLHGWDFDIGPGALLHYNPMKNAFEPIGAQTSAASVNKV